MISSDPNTAFETEFRSRIREYLQEDAHKIVVAWDRFRENQIWERPNESCLAPANQLIHLTGNLRQWVLTNLEGAPDVRERDAEFSARTGPSKAQILRDFEEVFHSVIRILDQPINVIQQLHIQGHETTQIGIWIHMAEHLSYHTGQLIFQAKMLDGQPFDFYSNWNLNAVAPHQTDNTHNMNQMNNMHSLQANFQEYVQLLANGSFIAGMDRFYADDIIQYENSDEPTHGRETLMIAERIAEKRIASAEIKICDAVIDEARGLVWGEMDIHFVSKHGIEQRLREAFRQNWRDGKIVEQRFWYKEFEVLTS